MELPDKDLFSTSEELDPTRHPRAQLVTLIDAVINARGNVCPQATEIVHFFRVSPLLIPQAVRLIAERIHSSNEFEALNLLVLLDILMKECGAIFQAEIGKFRFLNELIKLVSPKYFGEVTSPTVRQKVLKLLYSWTKEYSHESKILEAYEMLKKQGVVSQEDLSTASVERSPTARASKSIFHDDDRNKLLQKLLRSKNPDDLQAANRLIKTMVKEDERRAEYDTRRSNELAAVSNNIKLLNEMLDSFKVGQMTTDELEVLKEVYNNCERQRAVLVRLAYESQDNGELLVEIINTNELLGRVCKRYSVVTSQTVTVEAGAEGGSDEVSLLDLNTPSEESVSQPPVDWLTDKFAHLGVKKEVATSAGLAVSEDLGDIFGSLQAAAATPIATGGLPPVLEPIPLQPSVVKKEEEAHVKPESPQPKGLFDLDLLGETLLKDSLPSTCVRQSTFQTKASSSKIPMNQLPKYQPVPTPDPSSGATAASTLFTPAFRDSVFPVPEEKPVTQLKMDVHKKMPLVETSIASATVSVTSVSPSSRIDSKESILGGSSEAEVISQKCMDITLDSRHQSDNKDTASETGEMVNTPTFSNLIISVSDVTPANIPPLNIYQDPNGLTVLIHFTEDIPVPDVSVMVVTTINKSTQAVSEYKFQAVMPKECKVRLLPSSSTELPGFSPFLPPAAITQIVLVHNPNKVHLWLKYLVTCKFNDETFTEIGEVKELPL